MCELRQRYVFSCAGAPVAHLYSIVRCGDGVPQMEGDFAAVLRGGQFPHTRHQPFRLAALDKTHAVAFAVEQINQSKFASRWFRRSRYCALLPTDRPQRAGTALRRLRRANGSSEFHHRLVKVPGSRRRNQLSCCLPVLRSREPAALQAFQHPLDVAVDYSCPLRETDARNRRSRIATDASQLP